MPDASDDEDRDVGASADRPAVRETAGSRQPFGRWLRGELGLGLEAAALAAFAFSRPVLDAFGESPETFVINGLSSEQVILFGVVVALVPALVAMGATMALGSLTRWLTTRWRVAVHAVAIGLLAGVGANRMGQDQTGWPWTATKLLLIGVSAAAGVGLLRWWSRSAEAVRTFLRFGSVAVLVFAFQFLAASPAGEMAFGSGSAVDADVAEAVAGQLGDDPPPVVMVVFDALPTTMLLDGEGGIDADLYPNFARLTGDSTFYRNTTTVSGFTAMAVPALMRGTYPEREGGLVTESDENIFTLLGGSYDVQALEQITRFCPVDVCSDQASSGVGPLLGEAANWWIDGAVTSETPSQEFEMLTAREERYEATEAWIDGLRFGATNRPELVFMHTILPHNPWQYTDEGQLYEAPENVGGFWAEAQTPGGHQRHVLQTQASDRLLGRLLDRLEEEGIYDEALVVVTADHGASFAPGGSHRTISVDNVSEIAYVPLLVKAPGQEEAVVDDGPVESVDVLPTITDAVGVEPFWKVDGMPAREAVAGRDGTRQYVTHEFDNWAPDPDAEVITFDGDDYFDDVLTARPPVGQGPEGAWRTTEHGDLVGVPLDELDVGDAADPGLRVRWSEDFGSVDLDEPRALGVIAGTDQPDGAVVALTLNGVVAGMGQVLEWESEHGNLLNTMLLPDLFEAGENEFGAYLVDGPVGDETLHPLPVDLT